MRPGLHVDAYRTQNGLWTGCVRSDGFGKPTYIRPRKGFPSEAAARAYGERVLSALRAEAERYKRDRAQDETAEANERYVNERYGRPIPDNTAIEALGLSGPYSHADVVAAFRRKAHDCHPDKGGSPADFQRLVAAKDRALSMWQLRNK